LNKYSMKFNPLRFNRTIIIGILLYNIIYMDKAMPLEATAYNLKHCFGVLPV